MRRSYVDIAEGQVHLRERPGDPAHCPVVFLHQTASSGAMWDKVMARWPGSQRLVAPDTPGFGMSFDPPPDTTMAHFARWTAEVLVALGIGASHLVGHHTGAAIALALAAHDPARVASLSLIGPSCADADERAAMAARFGRPFRPARSGAYLLQNWEYLRVGGADADVALLHREMIDMLRAWQSRPLAYGAVWSQDGAALLAEVSCPMLLMAARDDILYPHLSRAAAIRPDARVVELASGANFEPDPAPDALCDAIAGFIAGVDGGDTPA